MQFPKICEASWGDTFLRHQRKTIFERSFTSFDKDNKNAAIKVKGKFLTDLRRLADFPEMGNFRPEIAGQSLRVWSVYSCLIIYRPDSNPLQILPVIYGARDLQRIIFSHTPRGGVVMTSVELVTRLIETSERNDVPYMVDGSFASSWYGRPRLTAVADFVI